MDSLPLNESDYQRRPPKEGGWWWDYDEIHELGLSLAALGLRGFLIRAADQKGRSWWGVRKIAAKLRVSPNTIRRATKELEGLGLLRVTRGRKSKRGDYDSNLYQVLDPPGVVQNLNHVVQKLKQGGSKIEVPVVQNVSSNQDPLELNPKNHNNELSPQVSELLEEYRKAVPEEQHREGDYSFLAELLGEHGYASTLDAIQTLTYRLKAGERIQKPLLYLRGILSKGGGLSRDERNRRVFDEVFGEDEAPSLQEIIAEQERRRRELEAEWGGAAE